MDCERWVKGVLVLGAVLAATGCGSHKDRTADTETAAPAEGFALHSTAFKAGGRIPVRYTCAGAGLRPPLAWTAPPQDTKALAIAVEDPDAPGGTFTHWMLVGIQPTARRVPVRGVVNGRNSAGSIGWTAPCPPPGKPHRYVFRLFALDGIPTLKRGFTPAAFNGQLGGHVIAETRIIALYGR